MGGTHWLHLANTNVFHFFSQCVPKFLFSYSASVHRVRMNRRRVSLTLLHTTRFPLFSTLCLITGKAQLLHLSNASAIPATCHILAPLLARDANGKEPGRNRRESRQREHRKGERNGRQGEGTRNVMRCIAWEAGNGRQREEM